MDATAASAEPSALSSMTITSTDTFGWRRTLAIASTSWRSRRKVGMTTERSGSATAHALQNWPSHAPRLAHLGGDHERPIGEARANAWRERHGIQVLDLGRVPSHLRHVRPRGQVHRIDPLIDRVLE